MKYVEVVFGIPVNKAFTYSSQEDNVDIGYRVTAPFGNQKLTGYVTGCLEKPDPSLKEIKPLAGILDTEPVFDNIIIDMAVWISRLYICSIGEALQNMLPGGRKPKPTDKYYKICAKQPQEYELANQQKQAIDTVLSSTSNYFYLYGVTGSGKTRVFLELSRHVLNSGKSVIYLVPEISLTHQIAETFIQSFGKDIVLIHSGLTKSEKLYEWLRILNGTVKLVIGARSAVFAPVKNLGLIIIDEEHEGSYKSSNTPRYHARQAAMYRCKQENALLVMGSATPSMEAYHQMKEGNIVEIRMTERLSGGSMPRITIIDMKKEKDTLSRELVSEINAVHAAGRQTILFLNRRGFSYYFHCKSCGYEMKCSHCSVSLTFHKAKWQMICHYCGFKTKPVDICPSCASLDVGYSGFGTEKIEEEVVRLFPEMVIKRLDTDAVKKKDTLSSVLKEFEERKIDILLGTQMVAKGLNFPDVMLVGIIAADTGLQLPDFRAAERTFSLITQVSGRAGRFFPDGKVIVQTFQPNNFAITNACAGTIDRFYDYELLIRKELGFPPYERLIRILFRGKKKEVVTRSIGEFTSLIEKRSAAIAETLGPVECPIAVIAGNHRFHVLFKTKELNKLHSLITGAIQTFKAPSGIYIEIDIDPVSLL